jgi:hypothetical protein
MATAIPPRQPDPGWSRPVSSEVRKADPDVVERFRTEHSESGPDFSDLQQDLERKRKRTVELETATRAENEPKIADMIDPATLERARKRTRRRDRER